MQNIEGVRTPNSKITADIICNKVGFDCRMDQIGSLIDNCDEPNPFYDSEVVSASLRYVLSGGKFVFVFIYAHTDEHGEGTNAQLIGFFPFLVRTDGFYGVLPTLCSFSHKYCFVHTPLVDRRYFEDTVAVFFFLLRSRKLPFLFVDFINQRVDGAFLKQLLSWAPKSRCWVIPRSFGATPVLTAGSSLVLSRNRGRRLRQQLNKLTKEYEVEIKMDANDFDVNMLMDEFLDIEHSGWKGKKGSSFESNPEDVAFFRHIISFLHETKRLSVDYIQANDEKVALYLNFCSSETRDVCYGFKTSYDENYRKFSPGILLLYQKSINFLSNNPDGYFDSCASRNRMVEDLWKDREEFLTVTIGVKTVVSHLVYIFHKILRQIRRIQRLKPRS